MLSNELLLAIPFFTFMGVILERCGLAEDLLEGFGQLFGGVRGGLSYAVILVGAILGAITGTVAASVIAMGLISLPVMTRYGYNVRHATGVIAASGTITQLIPPSLVLIVLADQLGKSPGDMYIGATGASIVQVLLFAGWVFILSIVRPHYVPALPPEARTLRGWPLAMKCIRGMVPSLALIFIVLGTIFMGLATPTEAGAMGVVGAMLLAWMNRRLTWSLVYQGMDMTMRLTAMVVFILLGARVFSLVFQGVGGSHWIEGMLTSLPGGVVGFLVFVNIFIFVIAFFLDFFEIAFIIVPLLAPVATALGIDLIWFGVMICANMQTSFMHPPFGFALFYLRGIAPQIDQDQRHLLGRHSVGRAAGYPGRDPDRLPGAGDLFPRSREYPGSRQDRNHRAGARRAVVSTRRRLSTSTRRRSSTDEQAMEGKPRSSAPGPFPAGKAQSFPPRCCCIMNVSKVYSETCAHRYASLRKAFWLSCTFLKVGIDGVDLVVGRVGGLEAGRQNVLAERPAAARRPPPGCARRPGSCGRISPSCRSWPPRMPISDAAW